MNQTQICLHLYSLSATLLRFQLWNAGTIYDYAADFHDDDGDHCYCPTYVRVYRDIGGFYEVRKRFVIEAALLAGPQPPYGCMAEPALP